MYQKRGYEKEREGSSRQESNQADMELPEKSSALHPSSLQEGRASQAP